MEELVKVVCPQCRTILSFKDMQDIGSKLIVCPRCQFRATVDVYRSGKAGTGGSGASDDTLPPELTNDILQIGVLRLVETDEVFELKEGQNVIGRVATTGDADIKLGNDPYMSRRHVRIDVVKKKKGFEHRLVEINSTNPVLLNATSIPRNEILVLNFGDKLVLGKTEVVFEKPVDKEDTLYKK